MAALNHKAAVALARRSRRPRARRARRALAERRQRVGAPAEQQHLDVEPARRLVGRDAADDHDAAARVPRRARRCARIASVSVVRPVVEHARAAGRGPRRRAAGRRSSGRPSRSRPRRAPPCRAGRRAWPRSPGRARSSSRSIAPVPPPTSTTVRDAVPAVGELEASGPASGARRGRSGRRTPPRRPGARRGRPRTGARRRSRVGRAAGAHVRLDRAPGEREAPADPVGEERLATPRRSLSANAPGSGSSKTPSLTRWPSTLCSARSSHAPLGQRRDLASCPPRCARRSAASRRRGRTTTV